jgi:hypothetical protein
LFLCLLLCTLSTYAHPHRKIRNIIKGPVKTMEAAHWEWSEKADGDWLPEDNKSPLVEKYFYDREGNMEAIQFNSLTAKEDEMNIKFSNSDPPTGSYYQNGIVVMKQVSEWLNDSVYFTRTIDSGLNVRLQYTYTLNKDGLVSVEDELFFYKDGKAPMEDHRKSKIFYDKCNNVIKEVTTNNSGTRTTDILEIKSVDKYGNPLKVLVHGKNKSDGITVKAFRYTYY